MIVVLNIRNSEYTRLYQTRFCYVCQGTETTASVPMQLTKSNYTWSTELAICGTKWKNWKSKFKTSKKTTDNHIASHLECWERQRKEAGLRMCPMKMPRWRAKIQLRTTATGNTRSPTTDRRVRRTNDADMTVWRQCILHSSVMNKRRYKRCHHWGPVTAQLCTVVLFMFF